VNVIGLDLSINGTGICVARTAGERLAGTVKMGDARLSTVYDAVLYYTGRAYSVVGCGSVGLAVIEHNLPMANSGNILDYVHGAARAALAKNGVSFAYVYPTTLKAFATGDSTADKDAMVAGVKAATGWTPESDDVADAWWLRQMGLAALTGGRDIAAHRFRAISAVEWPDWVQPYGAISARKPVTKKCKHGVVCLRNGDHWLHPFDVVVCDKPPKATVR
jgi:hypothetical protein